MSGSHLEDLDLFYQEVRQANSRPLWMMGGDNLTTEPQPKTVAFVWKWKDLRPLMYRAAQLIPVEQAERRVLVFANPGLEGKASATNTLMANLLVKKVQIFQMTTGHITHLSVMMSLVSSFFVLRPATGEPPG